LAERLVRPDPVVELAERLDVVLEGDHVGDLVAVEVLVL
jgi:hypothetical protein